MKKRTKVLEDHKKRGQVLLAPFTDMLGPLNEISWRKTILPELVWIALIHSAHGDRRAVELITALTRSARGINSHGEKKWLAAVSDFSTVSQGDFETLTAELDGKKMLAPVQEALAPLVAWYPECPLAPIIPKIKTSRTRQSLSILKSIVAQLYARSARGPMMVQATAVWLAFDADILKVSAGLSLSRFPEIEQYPKTELSQKIGASIRSTLNAFFGSNIHYKDDAVWPRYFWNHGLAIDRCEPR
jgi:hypothetical protein